MLLDKSDPAPAQIVNADGRSAFLLLGDHAGNAVPARLGGLGLPPAELQRHIGWDIGVAALGARLSARLGAVLLHQAFSRLVIDCNRHADAPDLIAPVSDGTVIPGNADLTHAEREARRAEIYEAYHAAIAEEIDRRTAAGHATILVALHSFTPMMSGVARPWQIGVLHDRGDTRFAAAFLKALQADATRIVGDNQPYVMDGTDYTVPRHAYPRGLAYVEIEVRQDLLGNAIGVSNWAATIEQALTAATGAL